MRRGGDAASRGVDEVAMEAEAKQNAQQLGHVACLMTAGERDGSRGGGSNTSQDEMRRCRACGPAVEE